MVSSSDVYDLGEVNDPTPPAAVPADPPRREPLPGFEPGSPFGAKTAKAVRPPRRPVEDPFQEPRVEVAGSLALILPGAAALIRGEHGKGLFYLVWFGFLLTLAVSILGAIDRITPTLLVLEWPRGGGIWVLGMIYVAAGVLHVSSVRQALRDRGVGTPLPPTVTGLASAALPGWGQVLNRDGWRAAAFLAGLWTAGAAWILVSPATVELLDSQGLYLPDALVGFSSPIVRWTLPAVIWALAVYDATATAVNRNRRG
jgi:hypothetical protein